MDKDNLENRVRFCMECLGRLIIGKKNLSLRRERIGETTSVFLSMRRSLEREQTGLTYR